MTSSLAPGTGSRPPRPALRRTARLAMSVATLAAVLAAFFAVAARDGAGMPLGVRGARLTMRAGHVRLARPPRTVDVLVRSAASFPVTRDGATLTLPVCVSRPLTTPDGRVTRAVIAIHGADRNAEGYWDYAAAGLKGVSGVLLVAPRFAISGDSLTPRQLYWTNSGWSRGDVSAAIDRPWSIGSFEILDEMVARLRATFVNLRTVIVIGHSGGGQMVQRYAAASGDPGLRFVVMNPGSYLYLSPERPAREGGFAVPAPAPAGYDDYKYGLQDLNDIPYVEAIGAAALRSRYEAARVRYLLGELDTGTTDPDLDVSPAAMLQGRCRLQRGELFFDYLGFTSGAAVYERHSLTVVLGVGHSAGGMFRSAAARAAMTQ